VARVARGAVLFVQFCLRNVQLQHREYLFVAVSPVLLMEIVLLGLNHRTAPVELRERVAFTPEKAGRAAAELRDRGVLAETLVLSTCNRSELYGVPQESAAETIPQLERYFASLHEMDLAVLGGSLYQHRDHGVVRHVFRVAAGLDSMLLGEAEILGQVRDAYKAAYELGATGPVLNRMFQAALEVGKRVRTETEIGTRPVSVAFAGVKLAEQIFGKLSKHCALILGAGAVSEQVVEHLRDRGIARLLVTNRSAARARDLAERWKAEMIEWEKLEDALGEPDMVVSSVGAEQAVISRAMVERAMQVRENRALFLIDLGVPRNVAAEAGKVYNVYLYNVDDLSEIVEGNKRARAGEIPRVEAIIEEHILKFQAWQTGVEVTSVLRDLRAKLATGRDEFLREQFARTDGLTAGEQERMKRLVEEALERLVISPFEHVRNERDLRKRITDLEAVRRLFGLDQEKP
jgi:glutamyl-tRNA reductase